MLESAILKPAWTALVAAGARVWRNNVGVAVQGPKKFIAKEPMKVDLAPGDAVVRHAHYVVYGLATGSSDLVGLYPLVVTPAMVGKTVAVFVSAEAKNEAGNATKEQRAWLEMVNGCGGIGFLFRSTDAALTGLKESIEKLKS